MRYSISRRLLTIDLQIQVDRNELKLSCAVYHTKGACGRSDQMSIVSLTVF